MVSTFNNNKENFDFNNTGRTTESHQTKYGTYKNFSQNEFTSTSSIDMSAYGRAIQPIKYKDPNLRA